MKTHRALLAVALVALPAAPASAGIVLSGSFADSSSTGTATSTTSVSLSTARYPEIDGTITIGGQGGSTATTLPVTVRSPDTTTDYTVLYTIVNASTAPIDSVTFAFGEGTAEDFTRTNLGPQISGPYGHDVFQSLLTDQGTLLQFCDGLIAPGGSAQLQFTLSVGAEAPDGTTGAPYSVSMLAGASVAAVPEPAGAVLMGTGGLVVGLGLMARRRRA